jgi:hypothetical protein
VRVRDKIVHWFIIMNKFTSQIVRDSCFIHQAMIYRVFRTVNLYSELERLNQTKPIKTPDKNNESLPRQLMTAKCNWNGSTRLLLNVEAESTTKNNDINSCIVGCSADKIMACIGAATIGHGWARAPPLLKRAGHLEGHRGGTLDLSVPLQR